MPALMLDKEDLATILRGKIAYGPAGLRLEIENGVLDLIPPSYVKDILTYLEGQNGNSTK